MPKNITPEQIDSLLPQTQCGLCGHGGCMPYAEAIVFENAPINLCPPGGVSTLRALGDLLGQDPAPYIPDMEKKAKPAMLAVIREAECIGCTKCIQACPVDAIIGSAKQMHSVISADCTGCELCITPCPVDCIDMLEIAPPEPGKTKADYYRQRFQARQKRLADENASKKNSRQNQSKSVKQSYIQAAIERVKEKKQSLT
jgi:electron transport complex protein RnfB